MRAHACGAFNANVDEVLHRFVAVHTRDVDDTDIPRLFVGLVALLAMMVDSAFRAWESVGAVEYADAAAYHAREVAAAEGDPDAQLEIRRWNKHQRLRERLVDARNCRAVERIVLAALKPAPAATH